MPPFSKQCLLEAGNLYLTFYKTRQLATWLKVSPKCQVQTGFQAYSYKRKRFILSIKIPVIPPPATTNWVCYNCEAARVNTMTGGLNLSFGFPQNGKIPHPHQVTWSQPINMLPVGNKGRAGKPAKVCTNKIALQTCSQSA